MAHDERLKEVKIGPLNDHHDFLRDNEFIHSGYRLNFSSTKRILKSLFMLHNESVNVWSHLLGVFLFLILIIYTLNWTGFPDDHQEAGVLLTNFKENLKNSYLSSLNAFGTVNNYAHEYELAMQSKMLELYEDIHSYSASIEVKVHNFYEELKTSNETEKFKDVIDSIDSMMKNVDSKKYD